MSYSTYRLFMPVGIWYTRRSDIELQRELWLSGNSPPPATLAELAAMIDTGQIIPAPRFGYCVQYGGIGKYFERREDALEYMCKRWKKDFILRHLDEAVAYADTQRPARLLEARRLAMLWKNEEDSGGGKHAVS